jgi:hypothetical protein
MTQLRPYPLPGLFIAAGIGQAGGVYHLRAAGIELAVLPIFAYFGWRLIIMLAGREPWLRGSGIHWAR